MKKRILLLSGLIACIIVGCGKGTTVETEPTPIVTETKDAIENEDSLESETSNELVDEEPVNEDSIVTSSIKEGSLLYEDDYMKVEMGKCYSDYIGITQELLVTNKTEVQINVLCRDVQLNNLYLTDMPQGSEYVQPGETETVNVEITYTSWYLYSKAISDTDIKQFGCTVSCRDDETNYFTDFMPASIKADNCPEAFTYNAESDPMYDNEYYSIYNIGYQYTDTNDSAHFLTLIYSKPNGSELALRYSGGFSTDFGIEGEQINTLFTSEGAAYNCGSYIIYDIIMDKSTFEMISQKNISINPNPSFYTNYLGLLDSAETTISVPFNTFVDYSAEIDKALSDSETLDPEELYCNY